GTTPQQEALESMKEELEKEQQKKAKANGHSELSLDEETKQFEFSNPDSSKKDNNALFFGTEGTGKTSIVRKLTYETDCYPLVEVKGSTLSPTKNDSNLSIAPLDKFILTLCDIDHTLVNDFGFKRETNGEVRYILFVDEADLVSRTAMIFDATYLVFLKEYMIARAVYRPGRLSNPLDFKSPVLNKEDNKKRRNLMIKDTGQLQHFDGKFISPKPPKIEDVVEKSASKIDETLAVRLEEVNKRVSEVRDEITA
ncbi:8332_t:CDS:2, partial [Funneliformis geosporum]